VQFVAPQIVFLERRRDCSWGIGASGENLLNGFSMNLWIRLLLRLLTLPFRGPVPLLGPCLTRFRVLPLDLDPLGHVNNGRYLTWLDLARIELLWRSGLLRTIRRHGYYPIVASETIHFRRPLTLMERVDVETRVLGWDVRSFYIQHTLRRVNESASLAIVRARFLSPQGPVTPQEVLALLGVTEPSPRLPWWVAEWVEGMTEGYTREANAPPRDA
jgi:YbgC/YbaW family acyl-CoA thioester hydrolase